MLGTGKYGWMIALLLAGGVGAPVSEDVVIFAGGFMAGRGAYPFLSCAAVCVVCVVTADLMLLSIGRALGPRLAEQKPFCWFINSPSKKLLEEYAQKYGDLSVLVIRFAALFRVPLYLMLGAGGYPRLKFLALDLLIAAFEVPLLAGLAYIFGSNWHFVAEIYRNFKRQYLLMKYGG